MVGCGKANSKPRMNFARLDPVSLGDSSGRSILFSITQESRRTATSSPVPKMLKGNDLSRVDFATCQSPAPEDAHML